MRRRRGETFTCISVALAYPPSVMGTENCSINTGSVPSFPGKTKSNNDHSSLKLFCIGEPDRMMRWGVANCEGGEEREGEGV